MLHALKSYFETLKKLIWSHEKEIGIIAQGESKHDKTISEASDHIQSQWIAEKQKWKIAIDWSAAMTYWGCALYAEGKHNN